MAAKKTKTNKPANNKIDQAEYRQQVMDIVCGCMAEGQSLRRVCLSVEGVPSHSTIMDWCRENNELANQYARAREQMTDVRFDEFRDQASETVKKYIAEGWEPKDAVAMAKLECANTQWELSKLAPKKYGDRIEHAGNIGLTLEQLVTGSAPEDK